MQIRNLTRFPLDVALRASTVAAVMIPMLAGYAAAFGKAPKEGIGLGVAIGGYGASETGVTTMYATTLGSGGMSDQIGLEVIGTYSQGSLGSGLFNVDVNYFSAGVFGTYRYGLSDQIDVIGLLGGNYVNVDTDFGGFGYETGGFSIAAGVAAEYEVSNASAIRAQLLNHGKLDLMYIIRQ